MIVNDALIDKLAHLSRLELKESEKGKMKTGLEEMIAFIDKLNELDTTNVEPLLHISENNDIFRKDEVKNQLPQEAVFKNAPLHDNAFFKVPKVIKKM